jgi:hypothetical protein
VSDESRAATREQGVSPHGRESGGGGIEERGER